MTQRINYIDRMKGFAILMVVLAHVILFSFDMSDSLIFKFCASFEMPLFMFVSGFVAFIPGEIGGAALTKLRHRFISYVCPAFAVAYILALYKFLILDVLDKSLIDTLIGGLWYLKALAIFVFASDNYEISKIIIRTVGNSYSRVFILNRMENEPFLTSTFLP